MEDNVPSEAPRVKTYVPAVEKVTLVVLDEVAEKETVPGPEILLQVVVRVEPVGRPSSEAVPYKVRMLGKVTL